MEEITVKYVVESAYSQSFLTLDAAVAYYDSLLEHYPAQIRVVHSSVIMTKNKVDNGQI